MRGETVIFLPTWHSNRISIHSPHARGDSSFAVSFISRADFNPLPSCEGRLDLLTIPTSVDRISIRSPHARGDSRKPGIMHMQKHFNPLPSCEGRLVWLRRWGTQILFQSTPLMRGETRENVITFFDIGFQSTPLMRGETELLRFQRAAYHYFNPLPSCEGRQYSTRSGLLNRLFQSTPLMRGETMHSY